MKDKNAKGSDKTVLMKHGFIEKRLTIFESKTAEKNSIEWTISNKNWCIFLIPKIFRISLKIHFLWSCRNLLVKAQIITIDVSSENDKYTSFISDLRDTFNLKNFVTKPTCHKSLKDIIIDLILTNKPRSFQKTSVCETGLARDCHKLIFTILKFLKYFKLSLKKIRIEVINEIIKKVLMKKVFSSLR